MKNNIMIIPIITALAAGLIAVGVSGINDSHDIATETKEKLVVNAVVDEASIERTTPEIKDPAIEALMEDQEMIDEELEYKLFLEIKESGDYDKNGIEERAAERYAERQKEIDEHPDWPIKQLTIEKWTEYITKCRIQNATYERFGEYKNNYLFNLVGNAGYCDKGMTTADLRDMDKKMDFFVACCKTYKDDSLKLDDSDKARIAKYLNDCYYFMPNYEVYNERIQSVHDMIEGTVPLQYGKRDLRSLWEQVEATSGHKLNSD